jgi:sugar O-acyltransferase (sialic acid O-acetyltransferase NeuD family)
MNNTRNTKITMPILIIGAGGHAKVVVDAIHNSKLKTNEIYIADDNPKLEHVDFMGVHIITPVKQAIEQISQSAKIKFHIAIGDNQTRLDIYSKFIASDIRFDLLTIAHFNSTISVYSDIAAGCLVAAQAIVGPYAIIGINTIVNHGAIIDHDVTIGNFCHIAPNATIGGNVKIGNNCLVGSSATILPNIIIGDNVIIGSGAVVTKNIQANCLVKGIPARAEVL